MSSHKKKKNHLKWIILLILIAGLTTWYYLNNQKEVAPAKSQTVEEDKIEEIKEESSMIEKILSNMTIEEKVGQLFLVRYSKELTTKWTALNPGGYLLFAKDFENHSKESIKNELTNLQNKQKYPLIIAVDEEGGYVTRVSRFKAFREEKFASPRYYYEMGGYEKLKETEKEKADLLTSIGVNLNLAPVADVSTDSNAFIYNRTFGRNASETAELIRHMVQYANENNISSCLKHFPGYGNNEDTHTGIAIDNRDYQSIKENDYLPFQAGIEENAPCVLISHNIITSIDSNYPASLSNKVINELRETLNYKNIIITDDLAMDAVKDYVENNEAATLARNAGNDMIITSDFESMYQEVLQSIKNKKISEERLTDAITNILKWKESMNLLKGEK